MNSSAVKAITLFPIFRSFRKMIDSELASITEPQIDWESTQWEWSKWSIRQNVSHVASHLFRWYLVKWGSALFPTGIPYKKELGYLAHMPHGRLDEERFWDMEIILEKLDQALQIVEGILLKETVASAHQRTITLHSWPTYSLLAHRYPGTLFHDPNNQNLWTITLAGTLHHSVGELITHLYNIQRLKMAQGLETTAVLPHIGYWTLKDWDNSQP